MKTEGCETRQKQETRNDWENYTKQHKKGKAHRRQDFVNQEQKVEEKKGLQSRFDISSNFFQIEIAHTDNCVLLRELLFHFG